MRRPRSNRHHGHRARSTCRPVPGDLPLHHEVGADQPTAGIVEQAVQDRGRAPERRVRHHAVRVARQRDVAHVGVQHRDVRAGRTAARDRRRAQGRARPRGRTRPRRERGREHAGARAKVDDAVVGPMPASATRRAASCSLPRKCCPSDDRLVAPPGTDHRVHDERQPSTIERGGARHFL